jgi:hypothetical protein
MNVGLQQQPVVRNTSAATEFNLGTFKGTITLAEHVLSSQSMPADTVLFQLVATCCCPVTAEAAASSSFVLAILFKHLQP